MVDTKGIQLHAVLPVVDACLQNAVLLCNWMYKPLSTEKLNLMKRNVQQYETKINNLVNESNGANE